MSSESPEVYLSPDQRALLLAALNSNTPRGSQPRSSNMKDNSANESNASIEDSSFDTSLYVDADALADVDYPFNLGNYDFEFETTQIPNGIEHEKRKLSLDDRDDEEADPHETEPKRREGDDRTAKKPGRKPITNEPTSKRKAQNRAAQRAFRERKEKHLKDLEQKVQDLEKISESTSQENKALKEEVEKLQTELKEYRKRFSLGGSTINRSPSNSVSHNNPNSYDTNLGNTGGFNFDFPLFGSFAAPGQSVVGNNKPSVNGSSNKGNSISPTGYGVGPGGILEIDRNDRKSLGSISPHNSNNNSPVVRSNSNGFLGANIQQSPLQVRGVSIGEPIFKSSDILSDLFSPSVLQAVNHDPNADYINKGSFSSVQSTPHMSSILSFSDSPSASSVSQQSTKNGNNNSSSCGTTPEATDAASPVTQQKTDANRLNSISEEGEQRFLQKNRQHQGSSVGELSFCEKLARACGNSSNPLPPAVHDASPIHTNTGNSFQWLAAQNGGNFEPVLFNDYRDSTDQFSSTVGMSYFDDAFPSAFDLTFPPTPPATSVEKTSKITAPGLNEEEDEEEEVVPADPKSLLKCDQIWDKVQSHPKFATGEIDMDNLCSELRAKVKCSESGPVVDKNDVDKILNKPMPTMWDL